MSYRKRGKDTRIQTKKNNIIILKIIKIALLAKIKNLVKKVKKKILIYSLKKINENNPAPYSVLKPDTNSDSPSAKSKGDRFLSATIEHSQQKKK